MPFTQAWDESAPDGSSTPASSIDTLFKELKRDIRERMNEILGAAADWETDPIIDGTLKMTIRAIVTALNSKTTVAGLTTGRLIQATGGGSIGNATLTDAQLVALRAIHLNGIAETNDTSSATVFDLSGYDAGIYLFTFTSNDQSDTLEVTNSVGYTIEGVGHLTFVVSILGTNTVICRHPAATLGNFSLTGMRLSV